MNRAHHADTGTRRTVTPPARTPGAVAMPAVIEFAIRTPAAERRVRRVSRLRRSAVALGLVAAMFVPPPHHWLGGESPAVDAVEVVAPAVNGGGGSW